MDWNLISTLVTVVISVGSVLVMYGKMWSRFSITVESLQKAVDKLTLSIDKIMQEQVILMKDVRELQVEQKELSRRITSIETWLLGKWSDKCEGR